MILYDATNIVLRLWYAALSADSHAENRTGWCARALWQDPTWNAVN